MPRYKYINPKEEVEAFGKKLAEAMVEGLNKKTKEGGYEMEIPKDL